MVRLFIIALSVYICQNALSQFNLNLDIDARQLTPMKLSDISEESRYVALKMELVIGFVATDSFLFVSTGASAFYPTKFVQLDLSGKIIRTFDNNNKRFIFRCDSKNKRVILLYEKEIEFWDLNGTILKKITLSERLSILEETFISSIIGFDQNCVWIMQQFERNGKICCRICRMNIESEIQETVLERDMPIPDIGTFKLTYKVVHSSFGGKSYIGFEDNVIYEVDGMNVRPVVKYNIRNYRGELSKFTFDSRFTGRYLTIKYGSNMDNYMIVWYDTKANRTWQMKRVNAVGGIEDDIFHTGTCDNYRINGDFLVFRKQSNDLPEEMNVEKDHTVIFITKLKQ